MDREALFKIICEILSLDENSTPDMEFNIFLYDSITKVNLILALESYTNNDSISIDELVQCDTYNDLLNLAEKMYEEVNV